MAVKEKYILDAEKGLHEEIDCTIQKLKKFSEIKDLEIDWVMDMFLKMMTKEVNKLKKSEVAEE